MSKSSFKKMADPGFRDISGGEVYLDAELRVAVEEQIAQWREAKVIHRLWQRDAALWTNHDEAQWLGWLNVIDESLKNIDALSGLATDLVAEGYTNVVLLGMGGSSLGPEVIARVSGHQPNSPELLVLDSTDPASIRSVEARINLGRTLFIVSSKSGGTLETNQLCLHFLGRVQALNGTAAGAQFVAITDPGTTLEKLAADKAFRRIYQGFPDIGGRFSVLSNFGLVPAALAGIDIKALLASADGMRRQCVPTVALTDNPGILLGAVLGKAKQLGRDKLTLIAPAEFASFGTWLEQLVAESTGKCGTGIVPIDTEPLGTPEKYGNDRIFVQYYLPSESESKQDAHAAALLGAGHPLIRIPLADTEQLGPEFVRWQFATAISAIALNVNPFDQPDVEASKRNTKALMAEQTSESGQTFVTAPIRCRNPDFSLYTDDQNWQRLNKNGQEENLAQCLKTFFEQIQVGNYFAFLAYLDISEINRSVLQSIRRRVRDAYGIATCLEFGPRFLHSTGQLYKGGPNTGLFLQITCDDTEDIAIAEGGSFGKIKAAQSCGDFVALGDRNRRLLGIHLGKDVTQGLQALEAAIAAVLPSTG